MSKDLDWNSLKYLLAAAQTGSLAGAARHLSTEHSTVARRLKALETELGGALFVRRADGLSITDLGRRAVAAAMAVERAVVDLQDAVQADRSRVRLALPSGLSRIFSANLHRLNEDGQPVSLELVSSAKPVDLARSEADMAVRLGPITDEDLVAQFLCHVGWSLYASPAYLRAHPPNSEPADLTGHHFVGFDATLGSTAFGQKIEALCRGAQVVLRGGEIIDVVAGVCEGAGIGLLPCHMAASVEGLVRLTPRVLAHRELWLVYRRELRLSAASRRVVRFVLEVVKERAAEFAGEAEPHRP